SDTGGPERDEPESKGQGEPGGDTGQEGLRRTEREVRRRQPGAIEAGREQDVVADGVDGQHHHPGEAEDGIVAQDQLGHQQRGQRAHVEDHRRVDEPGIGPRESGQAEELHRGASPNRPCGRTTSTSATRRVARILASVGEKNTEMTPSLKPTIAAATTVPRMLPSPPMMTTMKESSSGSCPIR